MKRTMSMSLLVAVLMFHSLPSRADPIDFDRCSDQKGGFEVQRFIRHGHDAFGSVQVIEKAKGKTTELFCGLDMDPNHAIETACVSNDSNPTIRVRVYREEGPGLPRAALLEVDNRFIPLVCGSAAKVDSCEEACGGLIGQWGYGICVNQCKGGGVGHNPKIPFNQFAAALNREVTGRGKEEITTNCWSSPGPGDLDPYAKKAADKDAENKCGSKAARIEEYRMNYDFFMKEHLCTSGSTAEATYRCETAQ